MSVFTPLERSTLEAFLAPYDLGRLRDFRGIAEGSENSNFFVSLEHGEFVLTLVERGPVQDLPFFIELLDVLHEDGLPVPYALRTRDGEALRRLEGKPALLQPRLAGRHERQPNAHHCQEVGDLLGHLHAATRGRILERPSDRGLPWMLEQGANLAPRLPEQARALLAPALAEIAALDAERPALPRANLHADLFRDNVLFDGPHLAGLIDFYNACSGWMLYDLAITALEAEHWPSMLRVACVRFWLSRLIAAEAFAGQDVLIHDPAEFEMRLAQRQNVEIHLPFAL